MIFAAKKGKRRIRRFYENETTHEHSLPQAKQYKTVAYPSKDSSSYFICYERLKFVGFRREYREVEACPSY